MITNKPESDLERSLVNLGEELSQGESITDSVLAKIADKPIRPVRVLRRKVLAVGGALTVACLLAAILWNSFPRTDTPEKEKIVVVLPPEAITFEIGDISIQCRYAFAVDNNAVLLCWRYSVGEAMVRIPQPEVTTTVSRSGQTRYRQLLVSRQIQEADGWQWTLLVAEHGGQAVLDPPAVGIQLPDNMLIRVAVSPRGYGRDELKHVLRRAQEMMAATESPFTLEEIERMIEESRAKDDAAERHGGASSLKRLS